MDHVLTIAEFVCPHGEQRLRTELMVLWDEKSAVHLHLPG